MGLCKKIFFILVLLCIFFCAFLVRGYEISINNKIVGFVKDEKSVQFVKDYLSKDVNIGMGVVLRFEGKIEYKPSWYLKSDGLTGYKVLKALYDNSVRYYKIYKISYNDNIIFFADRYSADNILQKLEDTEISDYCMDEFYSEKILKSSDEDVSSFLKEIYNMSKRQYYYSFEKPIVRGVITSRYGYRRGEQHTGIDLADKLNTNIYAAQDGEVIFSGAKGNYGNLIIIKHKYEYQTYYAHCNVLLVNVGDTVKRGQLIAKIGSTGRSTGPHVHFEIRLEDKILNPYDSIFCQEED